MSRKELIITVALFLVAIFFSTYKLTESPPTWMDEGMIVQVPKTLVEDGVYRIKVSPDHYISPSFISTSYPVTFPIALSFKLFGIGLLQARAVMVIFIMAFLASIYFLGRRLFRNNGLTIGALFLIISFPPLYGNGKNVLGEIPGLFFLTVFLIFLHRIYTGDKKYHNFVLCGLTLGLCIVTKPIFILLIPVITISLICLWIKKPEFFGKEPKLSFLLAAFCTILPITFWIYIQFWGDSFRAILAYYSNPHNVDIAHSLLGNIKAFIISPQPLYFLFLLLIWISSIILRIYKKQEISLPEWIVAGFSFLVLVAYFRNPGYYRYFFLAEIYCLFFFSYSVMTLASFFKKEHIRKIAYLSVILILIFQVYQLLFTSWVSRYYDSHKTRDCSVAIGMISPLKSIFFYQTPELVIFHEKGNYYQYLDSIENDASRKEKIELLQRSVPDFVIVSGDLVSSIQNYISDYQKYSSCERYDLFKKNENRI
jgi:4-amino-4-deoxy-L-arabinose transferase-like glycosyltransferase